MTTRFVVTADWHLTDKRPAARLDQNYFGAQMRKLEWVLGLCEDQGAALVIAGDIFDSVRMPFWAMSRCVVLFLEHSAVKVFYVYGQHDQRYHQFTQESCENTPLNLLAVSCGFQLLSDAESQFGGVYLYGRSFGADEFEIARDSEPCLYATHEMVFDDKKKLPSWAKEQDYSLAKNLVSKAKIVVCGDNHKRFVYRGDGSYLVNCGSLMRSSVDQIGYTPAVHIVEFAVTKNGWVSVDIKEEPIPVESANEVFDADRIEETERKNQLDEKLEAFIRSVVESGGEHANYNFGSNISEALKTSTLDAETKLLIRRIVDDAAHQ